MMSTMIAALMIGVSAAAGGKVEGTLGIDDKNIPLTHGCAMLYDNLDGADEPPEIRLLFSDREIASTELDVPVLFNLNDLAHQGALQGVQLNFDPKTSPREVFGGIFYTAPDPATAYPNLSFTGDTAGFTELKLTESRISGKAEYAAEKSETFPDDPATRYSISFDLPLQKCAPVLEMLTGEKAVASEQARIVLAFEKAVREGDLKAAAKLASPERMAALEGIVKQVGAEAFAAQAKQFIPETSVREKQIEKVIVREKRATLLAREEGATTTMPLIKVGKEWKIE